MDMDENYQKIMKKLKIKLFKSERYFEYFKELLLSLTLPPSIPDKKIKIYNLIQSKHSIVKKQTKEFWGSLYISIQKPSTIFTDNISLFEEKYLQYFSRQIYKHLFSMASIYSAPINLLKQEYLNLCIKYINNTKNKRTKTLRILPKKSINQYSVESKNAYNDDENNEKSSEDDDNEENNYKKYWRNKKPKNLIEKELIKLKIKSSNEIIEQFLGCVNNNDSLAKNRKEICFLYYIMNKKSKIFKNHLSKLTKKNFNENNDNEFIYNAIDNYDTIFPLEMKIKNQNYRNNKKKREKYFSTLTSKQNENNIYNNKKYYSIKKENISKVSKLTINRSRVMHSAKNKRSFVMSPQSSTSKNISNVNKINKLYKENSLNLPSLSKKEINKSNTSKFSSNINKKFFINGNDLFY